MNRKISSILFVIIFAIIPLKLYSNDFMFKHIEVKDGLSNNQINHIYRDSEGFMWFSTATGLNRYNGIKIDTYRNNATDNSDLADNYIMDVQEDINKNLWVHTPSAYVIFDTDTERFNTDIKSWMSDIGIDGVPTCMFIDKNYSYWFYLYGKGIYSYSVESKKINILPFSKDGLPEGEIICITECNGDVYVIYNNGLLACIDKENYTVKYTDDKIYRQIGNNKNDFFAAFVDMDEDLWIYGPFGLWVYSPQKGTWGKYFCKTDKDSSYDMVRAVTNDANGRIWIGKDQSGIDILDKNSGKIIKVECDQNDLRALHHNTINALYADKDGGMWIGAYKRGVSCYYECSFKFGLDNLGDINCIEEDKDGIVWLGTNDAGLMRWNTRSGEKRMFTSKTDKGLNSDVIVSMLLSKSGRLWIGTFWGGLSYYENGRFVSFVNSPDNKNSLANNNVWALAEDSKCNIWIGTLTGGLQCYDPQTGKFQNYTAAKDSLLSDIITSLSISRDNHLYIGTSVGVSVMNLATKSVVNLTGTKSGKKNFTNLNINQVYEDSRGLIWIATREGVNIYNPKTDDLDILSVDNGLSSQFISGLVEDNSKNMWLTTAKGVTTVIPSVDEKTGFYTYKCYSYDDKDGLQNCEYNQRSIKRLSSGEIVMGGLYGLNRHQPDQIKYNKVLPNVIFTDLLLFNEKIEIGKEYDGSIILDKSVNRMSEVIFEYEQNIFSVMFSSDNYALQDKVKYVYKLEGFNEDWLTTNLGKVTYTNLTPGKYKLKVKAINSDGYMSDKESCLNITVKSPFWLTGWAFMLYLIIIVLILFIARYLIIKVERSRYKMEQIEQSVKKTQELNDMKLRFFTNISHDLRTPLTLIISPIDALIKEYKSDDVLVDKLLMVQNNAMRLLNMVNQLLDFRKSDVKGHKLSLSEGDIVEYTGSICESFKSLSEKKNVHLTFFSSRKDINISFDADKMGKVLMNLLSNAFKFTPQGGRVDVSLDVIAETDNTEWLEIKVSDNGIGVKDEDKEHIFERFYQANSPEHTGSGVGLNIVNDFVLLHGGMVRVLDNVPAGSVFIVKIPVRHAEQVVTEFKEEGIKSKVQAPVTVLEKETAVVAHHVINANSGKSSASKKNVRNEDKRPLLLIVDDNEDFLTFMYDSLSELYRIRLAVNGREAWDSLSESIPDLIISDVMMPIMDGNKLCRLIKTGKNTGKIPFIMLTAKDSNDSKLEGLSLGADEYMSKPFNMDILLLRIKKLLDMRQRVSTQIEPEATYIEITSLDEKLINNAVLYIENNISNPDLSVEKLSQELGMSRVHLYKRLLNISGKTPIEFIRVIRLKRAAQLLRESQQSISEISFQVGFNNPKYFSKYFKEEFGVLPSTYQETEGK